MSRLFPLRVALYELANHRTWTAGPRLFRPERLLNAQAESGTKHNRAYRTTGTASSARPPTGAGRLRGSCRLFPLRCFNRQRGRFDAVPIADGQQSSRASTMPLASAEGPRGRRSRQWTMRAGYHRHVTRYMCPANHRTPDSRTAANPSGASARREVEHRSGTDAPWRAAGPGIRSAAVRLFTTSPSSGSTPLSGLEHPVAAILPPGCGI